MHKKSIMSNAIIVIWIVFIIVKIADVPRPSQVREMNHDGAYSDSFFDYIFQFRYQSRFEYRKKHVLLKYLDP